MILSCIRNLLKIFSAKILKKTITSGKNSTFAGEAVGQMFTRYFCPEWENDIYYKIFMKKYLLLFFCLTCFALFMVSCKSPCGC